MRAAILSLLFSACAFAQSEFKEYENGLIYSPYAMEQLGKIVDNKNEAFRKCDLTKPFYSFPQTTGTYFVLKKPNLKNLKQDISASMPYKDFVEKYGQPKFGNSQLVVKSNYTNYKKEKVINISFEPDLYRFRLTPKQWDRYKNKKYIIDDEDKKNVTVVFLNDSFKSKKIPFKYARMLQYSECMVDTTTQIFLPKAERTRFSIGKEDSKRKKFYTYVHTAFGSIPPIYEAKSGDINDYKAFREIQGRWDDSLQNFKDTYLAKDSLFLSYLEDAYKESKKNKSYNNQLEADISNYLSKAKALELKRSRIVVGSCSMDSSPRYQALDIAALAAESLNWNVFLRAHLNIMNDRVSRVSDNSIAWASRKTYIKELEFLNIDVRELMYGISLRVKNPSKNHYYGSIQRLGKAIAESKEVRIFKEEIIKIISDSTLDDYNRLVCYYLFQNLEYHLAKNEEVKLNVEDLEIGINALPENLRKAIKLEYKRR